MFSQPIPPLINGVSQQANDRRLPSQLESAENCVFSPVYGLGKRPPADYIGTWDTLLTGDPFLHLIERDVDAKYVLALNGSTLQVMDLQTGNASTVTDNTSGDAIAYLSSGGATRKDLRALTIADTTWLSNRKVIPAMGSAPADRSPANSPGPNTKYVWVKTSASSTVYTVRVTYASTTYTARFGTDIADAFRYAASTDSDTDADGSPVKPYAFIPLGEPWIRFAADTGTGGADYYVGWTVVAKAGANAGETRTVVDHWGAIGGTATAVLQLDSPLPADMATGDGFTLKINSEGVNVIAEKLAAQLTASLPAGFTVVADPDKPLVRIHRPDGADFDIEAEDDRGGNYISVIGDAVQDFSDLPPYFTDGGYVKVRGEIGAEEDDYWVRFEAEDGVTSGAFGTGTWSESAAPDIVIHFDRTTTPFRLVRNTSVSPATFTLEYANFDPRPVGDAESSPPPSWVGQRINDIFLFKNRLGFLAGDAVVLSRAGDFFNFWRSTVLTVLDDDPVDVNIGSRAVIEARHGVPFNEELIIFSDRAQTVLSDNGVLTPKSVSVATATVMDNDPLVRPVVADNLVFFLQERGLETLLDSAASGFRYHAMREYFADRDLGKSSRPLSDHCPRYIRGETLSLAVSPTTNYAAVVTDDAMYTYRWYDQGGERRQSAWSRWTTTSPTKIRWAAISGPDLIYSTYDTVCRIKLPDNEPDGFDGGWTAHLDRRIRSADLVVNFASGDTTVTLPYTPSSNIRLAYVTTDPGPPGNQLFNGSLRTPAVVGNQLIFQSEDLTGVDFVVGELYDMEAELSDFQVPQQGQRGPVPRTNGRVQVLSVQFNYMDSAHLTVEVTRPNRQPNSRAFTSDFVSTALREGQLTALVQGKNDEVSIKLKNSTPYPCWITGGEVELQYWNRTY